MSSFVESVLKKAASQVGVEETPRGSNRGPEVDAYLRSTGLHPGFPWCAAFVNWCIAQVAGEKKREVAWPKTASCDVILVWARRHDILFTQPEKGDVFLVLAGPNDATHTGFVKSVSGQKFTTIEGNSNATGSREGLGVVSISRPVSTRYRFVRWSALLPDAAPIDLSYKLVLSDKEIGDMPVNNGVARIAARVWGKALGVKVDWDGDARAVLIDGRPVPATPLLLDGAAYLPIRVLAEFSGLNVETDLKNQKVLVSRPKVS